MSVQPQPRPSDGESIEATAAAWLVARDDGLTAEQAEAFARWRAADSRHEAVASRLELTWSAPEWGPYLHWMRLKFSVNALRALRQETGVNAERLPAWRSRTSGAVARSDAASGVRGGRE